MPILCSPIEGGKKTAFQNILESMWSEKCKNVSGITIDFNRNDQLYLKYESCIRTAINQNELRNDVVSIYPKFDLDKMEKFSISHQQKIDSIAMSRKYCPKVDAFLGCKDIMEPINNECYDDQELKGQRVEKEILQTLNNYICANESDAVRRFIDAKVIECAMEKKDEVLECYHMCVVSLINPSEAVTIFSMLPKADKFCRSIESLGQCLVALFNQCTLSDTVGDTVSSLFNTVLKNTTCNNFISKTNIRVVDESRLPTT